MSRQPLSRFMALGLSLFALSACAHKPIAEQYRKEAKAEDLTFSMVYQNPDAYVGDIVLWGGVIIKTTIVQDGTQIIVLEMPLGGDERPRSAAHGQGRFIAMSSKFLEPTLYKAGRKITLAGEVTGKKTLPLGETTYSYPVVAVKQLHLWQRHPRYVYPYGYWGWGLYWGGNGDFDEVLNGDEDEEEGDEGDEGGEGGEGGDSDRD